MSSSRQIHIRYFAVLREKCAQKGETIVTQAATAKELYEEISKKYQFDLPTHAIRVAVNDVFKSWDVSLQSNDTVVFVPPVAGG